MSAVQTRFMSSRRTTAPARPAKSCDLCDGKAFDLIGEQDRRGNVLHTGICLRCGLVCHMAIPSDEELAAFYSTDYRREYHGETTPSARRVARAWNNAGRIYRQLAPHVRPGDLVFEVGAGIGCNVKAFELQGYDASGIEPNEGFCGYSVRQLRTRLEQADVFDLDPRPRYDLVLLVHVIEHFNSPRRALEHIRQLIRPGGRLYVECPNLAAPFARPGKQFHFAHVHNFTPESLRLMAGRCGFEVQQTFSDDGDPNLQMLLRRIKSAPPLRIEPDAASRTRAAMDRYNLVTYHLRWPYLKNRAWKLTRYLGEHLFAPRQATRLLSQCQNAPIPSR